MTMTKEQRATRTELREAQRTLRLALKELGKLREAFADQAGAVERLKAEAKEAKSKLKMLVADPIYAVPADLKDRVDGFEERLKAVLKRVGSKADGEDHERLAAAHKAFSASLDGRVGELEGTFGDHGDRIVLLEDQATAPHASPPTPRLDPRQTTLDEQIAKAKGEAPLRIVVDGDPSAVPEHDPDNDEDASSEEDALDGEREDAAGGPA